MQDKTDRRPYMTEKMEKFAYAIFQGYTQRKAWEYAGYSTNYAPAIVDTNACNLAKTTKIQMRLQELRQEARTAAVADYQERQEILSQIARSKLSQFTDENGNVQLNPDNLDNPALAEIVTTQGEGRDGKSPWESKKIKLRDPTSAIDLLNKMDGVYKTDAQVYNDIKVLVVRDEDIKVLPEGDIIDSEEK